jgi:hypothetical protein
MVSGAFLLSSLLYNKEGAEEIKLTDQCKKKTVLKKRYNLRGKR